MSMENLYSYIDKSIGDGTILSISAFPMMGVGKDYYRLGEVKEIKIIDGSPRKLSISKTPKNGVSNFKPKELPAEEIAVLSLADNKSEGKENKPLNGHSNSYEHLNGNGNTNGNGSTNGGSANGMISIDSDVLVYEDEENPLIKDLENQWCMCHNR